ncbi:hypothetical protein RJ41_11780 [Alteromonas marina]|uniref:Uncharacterized protein n=1 Tax=Alteromonas marina TaxID=203795 RepID=A0A0B3Y514_9ALTE|nr:hypothetical protein RJ41_11780 [Alteromonas marina]
MTFWSDHEMSVKSSAVEQLCSILIFFDRKAVQDQAIFCIGDKNLKQNDQACIFVNSFVS